MENPEFENEKDERELDDLAARSLRPSERLKCEDLVASELASGILSEPIQKIRHGCEALMLLDEAEREEAGISPEMSKQVEKLYKLDLAFLNVFVDMEMDSSGRAVERTHTISFPFPKSEVNEWAELFMPPGKNWSPENSEKPLEEKASILYEHIHCNRCNPYEINEIKSAFITKAMPVITSVMKKIIQMISPDSYRQALSMIRGGKRAKI